MEAYKFETIIQENGIIQIPEIAKFAHRQVEILVLVHPTTEQETGKMQAVQDFIDKWRGVLKDSDPDELKSQYLQEKYG